MVSSWFLGSVGFKVHTSCLSFWVNLYIYNIWTSNKKSRTKQWSCFLL